MSTYRRIPVGDLSIDESYQRTLSESRVRRMAGNWDDAMVGTLEVSDRGSSYVVFDGQHRRAAAVLAGTTTLPCIVHSGLSPQDEAALFARLQSERKALTAFDAFRARLRAGDQDACEVQSVLDKYGYTAAPTRRDSPRTISAVVALNRIHLRGGVVGLDETMGLIEQAWQDEDGAHAGQVLEGAFWVAANWRGRIKPTNIERLAAAAPRVVLRKARNRAVGTGPVLVVYVGDEIRKAMRLRGEPGVQQQVAGPGVKPYYEVFNGKPLAA